MKQEINIDMKPVEPIEFYTQINDMNQLRVLKQELERHLIITNGKYISLKEEFSNLYDSLSDEEKGYEIGEEPFVHAPMEFKNVRKRFNKLEAYLGQLLSTLQFITNKIDAGDGGGKCPIVDACRLGNRKKAEELFKLGEQYRRGWKVIADKNRAVGYYLEAVREGFSKAMDSLRQLAKKGHSGARFHLGEIYRNGNGVEKDVTTAIEWYKLATKQGHAEAATKLLLLAEEGSKDAVITLRKLAEKDNSLASERLKQLAELGNLEAQYHFGILLQKKKCHDDAKNWFFKAMLWGHSDAKEAYRAIIANNKT